MNTTNSPHEDRFQSNIPEPGTHPDPITQDQYAGHDTHDTTGFDAPHTEPDTALVPVTPNEPTEATQPTQRKVVGSFAGGTWVALIAGALLLILLLIFILQNQQQTQLNLLAWSFSFPAGVGYLLAAITGALIMALVGGVRMLQLRRQVRNP